MATARSPVKMMTSELGFHGDDQGLNIFRSGSAPPTVEGSLNAIGSLAAADEEMLSDPAYLDFYYKQANLNPRLPPPVLSKEDWRSTQRLGGDAAAVGSLFTRQPAIGPRTAVRERANGGGLPPLGRSFADILQDDLGLTKSSRPANRNTFDGVEPGTASVDSLQLGRNSHGLLGLQSSAAQSFASVVGSSLSRTSTADPQKVPRVRSPSLLHADGSFGAYYKENNYGFNGVSPITVESSHVLTALSGMNLSSTGDVEADDITNFAKRPPLKNIEPERSSISSSGTSSKPAHHDPSKSVRSLTDLSNSAFASYGQSGRSMKNAPAVASNHIGTGNLLPLYENAAASAVAALGNGFSSGLSLNGSNDFQNLYQHGSHSPTSLDPQYLQYLNAAEYASLGALNYNDHSMARGYIGTSYLDLLGMQLLQHQKQYSEPSHGYYGMNMSYPMSPLASPLAAPVGPGSPLRHADRGLRLSPGLSSYGGSWHSDHSGNLNDGFPSTLLEEFKSSKSRCFELSDIAGQVVVFSADQYGSRFIQQKLETATDEEKDMVFEEISPKALSLMTDVFGNYVIQKFFEHGTATQIRELASQLDGHVLALSLQMYGCRVIQKAIEVVSLDQQTKMVAELEGHVMRCVRDQNGNHVIQKCIECIPEDAIDFIVSSFYDQVVTLSTHPYGCRVIQRVLEHCHDPKTQQIVMDEIMKCVCSLAQDQYGNYVIQHVLEHGKPQERSEIIKKLAGQIVQMSQQKFASNVVEKCLTFGGPVERKILVKEMLGTTDENEPLQAMMKDQFANYVVQKVLETCDDQQRELILSRIKVHLNTLKKYTYGKHIVARVEKLVTAGERRIGLQSSLIR